MPETQNRRLDSWKEIAAYLGREVRTVIRWEKERKLPVHRLPGGKRHGVFAYSEELDSWLVGHGNGLNGRVAELDIENASLAESNARHYPLYRRLILGAVLALLLVALASSVYFYVTRAGAPASVSFSGHKLFAWDERGKLAWSYEFPPALGELSSQQFNEPVRIVDLDGDGRPDVLVVAAFNLPERVYLPRAVVHCFSSRGKLKWSYEPQVTLSFASVQFTGPWRLAEMLVSPGPGSKSVWLAFAHHTWWPSFVVKLDARGGAALQFVNSGHINKLGYVRNSTGGYVLAGGINNQYDAGVLAVLAENQSLAISPQGNNSIFQSDLPPQTRPYRYFVFSRTELSRLLSQPYPEVNGIFIAGDNIQVQTFEGLESSIPMGTVGGFYVFDRNFELLSESLADSYWALHQRLEKEGKINHTAQNCPDRTHPNRVTSWTVESGWVPLPPPVSQPKN